LSISQEADSLKYGKLQISGGLEHVWKRHPFEIIYFLCAWDSAILVFSAVFLGLKATIGQKYDK